MKKYTSIDRIFTKLKRDLGMDGIPEADIIEWTGEALEAFGAVTLYEEAVAFMEVSNHQCSIPNGTHLINQIARDIAFNEGDKLCTSDVVEMISDSEDEGEETACNPVFIDCHGQPITDYDVAYYRPYFDLKWEHQPFHSASFYGQRYVPVRLATNNFMGVAQCEDDALKGLYNNCEDEYQVVGGKILRFSFKSGFIILSYMRQMVDEETGYPMIPDHYSYVTAITKYITYKLMEKHFYNGREGAERRMMKAESDWQWYCRQAINEALIPKGIDGAQNTLDQRNYLLPRLKRYYGFFGKMSRPEGRKFNDPDYRNIHNYFRGNRLIGN